MPKKKRLQVILLTLLSEVHKERQNLPIFSVKIVTEKEVVLSNNDKKIAIKHFSKSTLKIFLQKPV